MIHKTPRASSLELAHEHHHRRIRTHVISLYTIILILLISQVFTMSMLVIRTEQLAKNQNVTYFELRKNQNEINSRINQLSENIISTQSDIKEQISRIKTSTSSDFSGIIEESLGSVVTVITDISQGTGFIITSDGYIVTNAHILNQARAVKVITPEKQSLEAELVGYDLTTDIALLKVSGNFNALTLGDSDNTKVGEKVIAIGNPLGLSFSATEGIISAVNRKGQNNLPIYLQTDVALNPGNSGGPLIDKEGEVIGINNFKIGGAESLGFALESNYVKSSVNDIALSNLNNTIL
jgi:S1-C subfamily serine protease